MRRELGWVSEYEERDVAHEYHYRWDEWLDMPVRERAATIAHSRISSLVEHHATESAREQSEREAKRKRSSRRSVGDD